jgi:hypothetical protein
MSEANPGVAGSPDEGGTGPDRVEPQHQHDGRYIPYSGGSLGWYQNTGVMKGERANNYQFNLVIDEDLVRAKQHLRSGVQGEKRRSPRKVLADSMTLQMTLATITVDVQLLDISKHGARLAYVGEELIPKNGAKVKCVFPAAKGSSTPLELQCTIVRNEKSGKTRVVWLIGVDFPIMNPGQMSALSTLLGIEA